MWSFAMSGQPSRSDSGNANVVLPAPGAPLINTMLRTACEVEDCNIAAAYGATFAERRRAGKSPALASGVSASNHDAKW
jgi:hypothetical protein